MIAPPPETEPWPPRIGGDDPDPRRPSRWGVLTLFLVVWLLTVLGGAGCGLAFGVLALDLAHPLAVVGAVLGAIAGLPLGVALGVVIDRPRAPSEVRPLTVALQWIGAAAAVSVAGPWIAYLALVASGLLYASPGRVFDGAPLAGGTTALVAAALVGWGCGALLGAFVRAGYRTAVPVP